MNEGDLKKLLDDMSVREKILQLVQLCGDFYDESGACTGPAAQFALDGKTVYTVGSILSERGAAHLKKMQDKFMEAQPHRIPAIFMADVIHGYRTVFPVPIALGCSFDTELCEKTARAAALESAAAGIHVTFSPMADLVRDSRWGRVMESTGEDPLLNSRMAAAMVKGFQGDGIGKKGNIAACAKHFAAYGTVEAGRDYNVTEICEHTLMEDHLPAYKAAIDAGVSLMMTAFNTVDRVPCTVNKRLMKDIMRDKLGFEGVLITDYNAVGEAVNHGACEDKKDAAKKAFAAGCEIDMMSDCYLKYLEELINEGEITLDELDSAVMSVLRLKNKLGLFENPYKDASEEDEKALLFCKEHRELSRKAAEETTILLKNNGVLPLEKTDNIAVIGALADSRDITGTWALFLDKNETVTLKQALTELYPEADITFFAYDVPDEKMLEGIKAAQKVIIAAGEDESFTGESRSVADISLSAEHRQLIETAAGLNKNIITVLYGGRPLALPHEAELSAALTEAWLPGSCGNYAIADILFGKVNPSGRLAMSMPYCTGQLPLSYMAFATGRPKPPVDRFVPFMSNYMDVPNTPLYPFGFGLSYSKVSYSPVSLDRSSFRQGESIHAAVTIKNESGREVTETVQMYIRDKKASVVRPLRVLKDFRRVSLKPDEEKTVLFEVTEEMLRFYDIDMNYVSEPGEFTLWAGSDSTTENGADFTLIK